ncbi:MAG: hypothetical protein COU63_03680 [Candidatus Pacebacteria bacterium CG10_big_fil_rev_8_21_14_0_10_36_11]|nr:hypothetical protein [Candidatus Pacearchaeota archaeon]OIP73874.1 MAG: hypothetical protein AUK08_04950 [Candidatus Pacebacteria bacterium CG2_30_36_39]PIR64562.1 MAG: hypothetical protein COU63_03680 [Candidatus Pacebacteria bacterium CG10_big_fil_rev_8_21_14_0_10_36_11]PJC42696.1 MAG: hypothetical protein CO040_03125 [Candidatus Pacebacteria bacterium CG_4_9_14_0_2_um_filter_36_8]
MSQKLIAATLDLAKSASQGNLPGAGSSDPQKGFGDFLSGLMGGIMVLAAIMVLLFLIWGAIDWITSAGDKGKLEAARNKITNSLIGLVVLAATTAIFMLIQSLLGICVLSFGNGC